MMRDALLEAEDEATWLRLWDETYRLGRGDADAARVAERWSIESGNGNDGANRAWGLHWLWGAKWLDSGRAQLVVGHKYAAALMASSVLENIAEDMIIPWKAFALELPAGLLDHGDLSYRRVTVGVYEGLPFGCMIGLRGQREDGGVAWFSRIAHDAASLFFTKGGDFLDDPTKVKDLDFKERAMQLAIRVVTGALYTMQHTDNFRSKEYPSRPRGDGRQGPPPHRVYFVGKPMGLDCRPAVAHYLSGHKSAPPSVQSIVRGHYKRQVIGIGRTGRKVIWVEPYWRGPEEAPILTRPYRVGASD
jgi:hypothetical protein